MARLAGHSNKNSAGAVWSALRKKIKAFHDKIEAGVDGAAAPKKGNKRKKGSELTGEDGEEIVESPKKKEKKKDEVSQDEPSSAWNAANAGIEDGMVKEEPTDVVFG